MIVSVDVDAAGEFVEAADWYNAQQPGLGDRFLAAAEATANALPRRLVHRAHDEYRHLGVHIAPVPGWPWRLIYIVGATRFHVIALAHERREPGDWADRLTHDR